jgi:hypothetical protein
MLGSVKQTQATPGATTFGMVGITSGQTLQLNLVAWPNGPCMAQLGFQDSSGLTIGETKTVTLQAGESASLALNGDTVAKAIGERVEVLPVVTPEGGFPEGPCHASAEVKDNIVGIATVGVSGLEFNAPPSPVFGVLSLSASSTARLKVVAFPNSPCIGELGFADKDGNQIGTTMKVGLQPGEATFLDFTFPTEPGVPVGILTTPSILIHPLVIVAASIVDRPVSCVATVEVFRSLTGRTLNYYPPNPCIIVSLSNAVDLGSRHAGDASEDLASDIRGTLFRYAAVPALKERRVFVKSSPGPVKGKSGITVSGRGRAVQKSPLGVPVDS